MPSVSGNNVRGRAMVAAALIAGLQSVAPACMVNPNPVGQRQPDGTEVTLRYHGDKFFYWCTDEAGYTVVRDDQGFYVHATVGADGELAPTKSRVGIDSPAALGLKPGVLPSAKARRERAAKVLPTPDWAKSKQAARVPPTGTVPNLVILARFADHTERELPTREMYDELFNVPVEGSGIAPTGSVRDVYEEMSYGTMTLESKVADWVTLPQSEAYYADGQSGLGLKVHDLIRDALAAADASVDFSEFDTDGDGYVDSIAFVHSGYGAEWGGIDEYGTDETGRIWSHRWSIFTGEFTSAEGVKVSDYHINPGLWDIGGSEIGHIGVICHETGHFFGLPDLYDADGGGEGIGSWCMMANSWGFTGDQLYPPHFSAWCKDELGWLTPEVISAEGTYEAAEVQTNPEVYKITQGFPSGEYLLIENRNKTGYDSKMPVAGGLAIWHIDEKKANSPWDEGYPGQDGWPENGMHYMVALLQADGDYDLEMGFGRGDGGDLYRGGGGVNRIAPDTVPNTDSYQDGTITPTGITISGISVPGQEMSFYLGELSPKVVVTQGASTIADNTGWVEFGSTVVGGIPLTRSFQVTNQGASEAVLQEFTTPPGFVLSGGLAESLEQGESSSFSLTIPTASEVLLDGMVSFETNLSSETPYDYYTYDFRVSGSVTIFNPYACIETFQGWFPEEISPVDPAGVQTPAPTAVAASVTNGALPDLLVASSGTGSLTNQTDGTPAGNVGASGLQYVSWKSMRRDIPGTLAMPIGSPAQLVMVEWTVAADAATVTSTSNNGRRATSVQTPTVRFRVGEMSNLGNGQSQDLLPAVGINKLVDAETRYRTYHYVKKGGFYDTTEGLNDAVLPFPWGADDDPPVMIGLAFDIVDTTTSLDPFAQTVGGQRLYGLTVERAEVYTTTRARLGNANVVYNTGVPGGFPLASGEPAPPADGFTPFNLQHWDSRDEGGTGRATFSPAEHGVVGTTTLPLTMSMTPGAGLLVATWDTRDFASSTLLSADGIGQGREVVTVDNGVLVSVDVWLSSPQGATSNNLLPGVLDIDSGGTSSARIGFQTDIWGPTGSGEEEPDDEEIPGAPNYFGQGRAGMFEFCASNREQYDTAYLMEPVYALRTGARRISYFFEPQARDAFDFDALSFRPSIQAWSAPANGSDLAAQVSGSIEIQRVVVTTYARPVLPDPICP